MGLLVNGQWHDKWYETKSNDGEFIREDAQFRNWITPTGEAGQTGREGFKAEKGRYHLFVSNACPWAHRTLIFRKLKGLEDYITVSVVQPDMLSSGWEYGEAGSEFEEHIHGFNYHYQIYTKADPIYSGRVTVPVLWDKQQETIVNNESAEIIRMFNTAFNHLTGNTADYYPAALQTDIDAINEKVYANINNGVYRCGFATTQAAYERAFDRLFNALDEVEELLSTNRYLTGSQLTEADWRLFTTLVRFDAVYVGHFKCNRNRIEDFPNIQNYLRELYQVPGVKETVKLDQIKRHYYASHTMINPTRVVPKGPALTLDAEYDRGRLN